MYRNHFSKKSSNFKTVRPKASAPGGAIKPSATSVTKIGKVTHGPKTHTNSINPTMVKSVNYTIEDEKPIIVLDFYDNIEGKPLDYVLKNEENSADKDAAIGFDNALLIPIYYPNGNPADKSGKPHIDELQNMFEWLIMSKDLKTTDPSIDPKDYNKDQVTYCLRLHADTRTIVKAPVNDKIDVDLSVIPLAMKDTDGYIGQTYPIEKHLNGEETITINYPVVWLGLYGEVAENGTASKPKFLRCYIEDFRASELYIASGSTKDGVYTPAHVTNKLPEVKITAEDNFSYYPDHATFVNCQKDGLFIEDLHATEIEGPCIPGYEIAYEEIQVDAPDIMGTAIISRPLQYADLAKAIVVDDTTEEIEAAEMVIIRLEEDTTNVIASVRKYADKNFQVTKPLLAFAYAYTDDKTDWIDSEHHEKGKYLMKLTSQAICAKISKIIGFHIKGPIDVYQIVNGQVTETVCKLRYLNNIELEDCLLEDEKDLNYDKIEYFWLYNVKLTDCDNKMKYYKAVNDQGTQIIGEEDQMVGTNGQGILKPMFRGQIPTYGGAGFTGSKFGFDTLDDLYAWLMHKHRLSTSSSTISAPEIVISELTAGTKLFNLGCKIDGANTLSAVYYHQGSPCKLDNTQGTDGKQVYLITDIKTEDIVTDKLWANVQFHLCWEAESTETEDFTIETKKYCDTYYGLVGSDYFGELCGIYLDVNKVETTMSPIDNPTEITSTVKPNPETTYPGPETMTAYLKKLELILERMPINTKYICEAAGLLAKYVTFENTRLPSYSPGDESTSAKGLDKNHPSSVAEATSDMYLNKVIDNYILDEASTPKRSFGTLKGNKNITYEFECENERKGFKDGDWIWAIDPEDDDYSHVELLEDLNSAFETLNWMCWGADSAPSPVPDGVTVGTMEQQLYVATRKAVSSGLEYYGQDTPVTKIGLTVEMLDLAELEIYEEEAIYQVHYAKKGTNDIVVGLSLDGSEQDGKDKTEDFINSFLTEINADLVKYLTLTVNKKQTYAINEFVAYLKPSLVDQSKGISVVDRNKLIEYSQMLNTIQGQRDFIQKKGEEKKNFLLKFQQTAKGTFFEVMKAEGDNYAVGEEMYGYYISQGYGYTIDSSSSDVIKVPKGRKEMRMVRGRSAAPAVKNEKPEGRFRITRMPRYYEQEPVDWRNDNYFCNQIYTLNADNLNTMIDPEFEAREKTIFTKDTAEGSTTGVKEQEMIGFYTITVTEN